MAKKIVGLLKPFILKQEFYIYEDSNKIDAISISVEDIAETVLNLTNQYSINQLDLIGPKKYSQGIGNKIKELENTKYNVNNIEINYL